MPLGVPSAFSLINFEFVHFERTGQSLAGNLGKRPMSIKGDYVWRPGCSAGVDSPPRQLRADILANEYQMIISYESDMRKAG